MKKSIFTLTVLITTFILSSFSLYALSPNLIVDGDTIYGESGTYDTVIIRNNGMIVADYLHVENYLLLETGGKLRGVDQQWFSMASENGYVINNSGPDAIKGLTMSLYRSKTTITGSYPVTLDGLFSGWSSRDVYLETDLTVLGRYFKKYANKVFTQGNDITLGKDCYFYYMSDEQSRLVVSDGSSVIKQIEAGKTYTIPVSENYYGFTIRTDITLTVNEGAVLGTNPEVVFTLFADSLFAPAAGDAAEAVTRFVNVAYNDIPTPDFDVTLKIESLGFDEQNLNVDVGQLRSALWNGIEWEYGEKINSSEKIIKWDNLTEEGTLTAGINLGLNDAMCYSPSNLFFDGVSDHAATLHYDSQADTVSYRIAYREKGAGAWNYTTTDTNVANLSGLNNSTAYELKAQAICESGVDTSVFSDVIAFETSISGYDSANNSLHISSLDTIASFIHYDSIYIHSGGTGVAGGDITINKFFFTEGGGAVDMGNYAVYGEGGFRVNDFATFSYGQVYFRNSQSNSASTLRNSGMQYIRGDANIEFKGGILGSDGQKIDDNFSTTVNDIIFSGAKTSLVKEGGLVVHGDFIINSGEISGITGEFYVEGNQIINNYDSGYVNAKLIVLNDSIVLNGTHPLRVNELTIGEASNTKMMILNNDLLVENKDNESAKLKLDDGVIDLNGNDVTIRSIDKSNGYIIAETGGKVTHYLDQYNQVTIPFTDTAMALDLVVNFNIVDGTIGDDASVTLQFMDADPPSLNSAPVDYITRYLDIQINDVVNPVYNVSFTYGDNDIVGDESNMEASIYSGSEWIVSEQQVDTLSNKVVWNGLTKQGILSAGNYIGYDSAKAVNLMTEEVTTSAASFKWEYMDDGVNDWTIHYKPTSSGTFSTETGISETEKRISGLTSGTEYEWYVSTAQDGGYPDGIGNSVRDTFTTTSGCDQPIDVAISNMTTDGFKVSWAEGVADYTVEYKAKDSANWNSLSPTSDDSLVVSGLAEQSMYYVRVASACGAASDSVQTNTLIEGWNKETNVLVIDTVKDIPKDFVFDKIKVKNGGVATAIADIHVKDSFIIEAYGEVYMDTFEITGFDFRNYPNSKLYTAHPLCLNDEENEGSVQTIVRDYNHKATYVINGTSPQVMDDFLPKVDEPESLRPNEYYYFVFNNPTTVTMPKHNMEVKGEVVINDGILSFDPYNYTVDVSPKATLINNAGENALNNHNVYLKLSGGGDTKDEGAMLKGDTVTFVDSVYCGGDDEPYIYTTLKVAEKIKTRDASWYDGFIIDSGKIIIDTGCVLDLVYSRHMLVTRNGGKVQINYADNMLDSTISLDIGYKGGYMPLEFTLNSNASLSTDSYITFAVSDTAYPGISDSANYLDAYLAIEGSGIISPDYNVTMTYLQDDAKGTTQKDTSLRAAARFDDGSYIIYDTVDYRNNIIYFSNLDKWGALFAVDTSSLSGVYELLNEVNPDVLIYPNPTNGIINLDIENIDVEKIKIMDITGRIILIDEDIKQQETIDISDHNDGVYILNVYTNEQVHSIKIIKE